MVQAAVLREVGAKLELTDIELAPTGPNQVRVRLAATGVCHSDLSIIEGNLPYPVPALLGHEGAGVVTEVGENVTRVSVGDKVVIAWNQPCRECFYCTSGEPYLCERAMMDALSAPTGTLDGEPISGMMGAGTFARETLVLDRSVVPIGDDVPLDLAALIGCAVTTGAGAVLNTAKLPAGSSAAIIGCGGVGLSALQGARIAGAETIIAIDLVAEKLEAAKRLGATHTVNAGEVDPVQAVRELTEGRGVDASFEVTGLSKTILQGYEMARRGGTTVVVGAGRAGDPVEFDAMGLFFNAKTIMGCVYGSSDPDVDFPRFAELAASGELDVEGMVTHRIGLEEVNEAFDRMRKGEGIRSLVVFED